MPWMLLASLACAAAPPPEPTPAEPTPAAPTPAEPAAAPGAPAAVEVVGATASGAPGAVQLAVTLRSPDTGCARFARWWEVVDADGALLYRRILMHAHVDEQPFTRGGGPVPLAPDQVVTVRAWLHPDGYGSAAVRGSVAAGFAPLSLPPDWHPELASQGPQPTECWR